MKNEECFHDVEILPPLATKLIRSHFFEFSKIFMKTECGGYAVFIRCFQFVPH